MGAMSTDSVIRSIVWRDDKIAETDIDFSTISARLADPEQLLWVGLQQPTADDLARLGKELDIDPAAIEDALNHVERPKALRYAHYSFVTVYAAKWAGGELSPASPGELTLTKLSAFTFPHGLVTVWYDPDFSFDEIIDRWSEDSYLSAHGSAMLVHGMLDYVVDGYFEITQDFDDAGLRPPGRDLFVRTVPFFEWLHSHPRLRSRAETLADRDQRRASSGGFLRPGPKGRTPQVAPLG